MPMTNATRFELAGGWFLQRVEVNGAHEWIICDPVGDRLGNTPKHKAELDAALLAGPDPIVFVTNTDPALRCTVGGPGYIVVERNPT